MKTIVFLRQNPYPRLYNHAFALKKSKYRTILVCRHFDEKITGILRDVFDEIICYQPPILYLKRYGFAQKNNDLPLIHTFKILMTDNVVGPFFEKISYRIKFLNILKSINADVYNCCSSDIFTEVALKYFNKPVFMDLHNGSIMQGVENLTKEHYIRDKFCFEHVNGIIHRGPDSEINYYKNKGYKINCPLLKYLDYCNRNFFVKNNPKKLSSEDGEYHLVNIGSGMQSPYIPPMLKKLFKQKIHMHLYLVPYSTVWNVYKSYQKMAKNEKYFHLHNALPFNQIQQEISKYDFGSIIRPQEFMDKFTPEALKISARSYRQYNFFEAGLPVIISDRLEYLSKMLKENKIGFSVSDSDLNKLNKIIGNYDYKELRQNVLRKREEFLIDNHVERLNKFYTTVIE
jgi:hypothetical protein